MSPPTSPLVIETLRPEDTEHVISLGAGVQSTVMYLLASHRLIPPTPIAAVFADTHWEPTRVYKHLDWLETLTLPVSMPIKRVSAGNLYQNVWEAKRAHGKGKSPFTDIPAFVHMQNGGIGMRRRQCTSHYKIEIIVRTVQEIIGRRPGTRRDHPPFAAQWIGISRDEWHRASDSHRPWTTHHHPLIELGFRRQDCTAWFAEHYPGQPLAKSSCVGCPYHSDRQWLQMYREEPDAMQRTIDLDNHLRSPERIAAETKGTPQYLHRTCQPLEQVLERLDRLDRTQPRLIDDQDLFRNECGGYCRV